MKTVIEMAREAKFAIDVSNDPNSPPSWWGAGHDNRFNAFAELVRADERAAHQEPVAAAKKDAVFAASIEFIGTLTGMQPPPIEVAPPEILRPFLDFTEKVCLIFAAPPPQPAREWVGLTPQEIREWWASENGLEDCVMSKLDDFEKVVRAIEAALGIMEKNT